MNVPPENIPSAVFLIESGRLLDMVKQHIQDRARVRKETHALALELDAGSISVDRTNGVLIGVVFRDKVHPEFTRPARHDLSYPKKKTTWAARFADQVGYPDPSKLIADAYNVPLTLEYRNADSHGWCHIGNMLSECGFLYLGENGPYAMWVPDVEAAVAARIAEGYEVEDPAKSFKLEFEGCRRIDPEEWEILVLQKKLADKRAGKDSAPAAAAPPVKPC